MPRPLLATILAVALAACGNASTTSTSSPGSTPTSATTPSASSVTTQPRQTTSSTAPTTTSTEMTTTSTEATTSTSSTTTTSIAPPLPTTPPPGPDGAAGAGCTPGSESLGDGVWFGLVKRADPDQLQFDLACWFTGDAAAAAAAEDGQESPPPNDYYVRNANPLIRTLNVAPGAQVLWYPGGDPSSSNTGTYPDWLAARDGSFPFGVWVRMQSGLVVTITEQWVP
jgi:hypothetical protein